MYIIAHLTDGTKTTTISSDTELIAFVKRIANENEDGELMVDSAHNAKEYLRHFCPNLQLN